MVARALLLTLAMVGTCHAAPILYIFNFQENPTQGALPLPTGSFTYDAATGQFSGFQVLLNGVTYDFTGNANQFGGNFRMPFELGILAQNLISGVGVVGPAQWWADDTGFQGFDWRTPATDFLYWDLAPAPGSDPNVAIFDGPNAYSGTWTTTIDTSSPAPEPGAMSLTLSAGAILLVMRRLRG